MRRLAHCVVVAVLLHKNRGDCVLMGQEILEYADL